MSLRIVGFAGLSQINEGCLFPRDHKNHGPGRHRHECWDETMQTPIKLDFQGMDATQGIRGAVGPLRPATAGRVVLKALGGHPIRA